MTVNEGNGEGVLWGDDAAEASRQEAREARAKARLRPVAREDYDRTPYELFAETKLSEKSLPEMLNDYIVGRDRDEAELRAELTQAKQDLAYALARLARYEERAAA